MRFVTFLVALFVASAAGAATSAPKCGKGVHIIVARESEAAPGPGLIGTVAERVIKLIPGSDMESVDYPALLDPYIISETAGIANMTKLITAFANKCPKTKMVLMGYSQGAHVTSDILCGASEKGFPETKPLSRNFAKNIAAVVLMGDPSFTANQTFNVGTSHGSGIFPRLNPGGCDCFASKIMSICDAGDMFCEAGSTSLEVHLSYVAVWGKEAAEFVVQKYRQH